MQRGMLTQLAARLRARQGEAGQAGGGVVLGEDGEAVILDDNCIVSLCHSHSCFLERFSFGSR